MTVCTQNKNTTYYIIFRPTAGLAGWGGAQPMLRMGCGLGANARITRARFA